MCRMGLVSSQYPPLVLWLLQLLPVAWSLGGVNRESFWTGRHLGEEKLRQSRPRCQQCLLVAICFQQVLIVQALLARWNRISRHSAGRNYIHDSRRFLELDLDTKCTISRRGQPSRTPCSLLPQPRGLSAPSANLTFLPSLSLLHLPILPSRPIPPSRILKPTMSSSSPSRSSSTLLHP